MSVDNAQAFLEYVQQRPDLQQQLVKLKGRNAIADLVRIAAIEGFAFSETDYKEAVVREAGGELGEESLAELLREIGMGE